MENAEIASIGEELDEAFLFQDNNSAGSSVCSSLNNHSRDSSIKRSSKSGFHKFWQSKKDREQKDHEYR